MMASSASMMLRHGRIRTGRKARLSIGGVVHTGYKHACVLMACLGIEGHQDATVYAVKK